VLLRPNCEQLWLLWKCRSRDSDFGLKDALENFNASLTSQTHNHRMKHNHNIGAMNSWDNGREDIFQQLTKVCDQIGNNIQAGIYDITITLDFIDEA
jgi:hypothetical protein